MDFDFARTQAAVEGMLRESLARLAKNHPDVMVNKLRLWGYGFGGCAHVLINTSDDKAVFGDRVASTTTISMETFRRVVS